MGEMAAPIEFWFDFSSPYGYLASERIESLAQEHGRSVVWRPFLLGAVFKVTGGGANALDPMRGAYFRHDMVRSARYYGLPVTMPERFPFAAVASSRAVYWQEAQDAVKVPSLVHALYRTAFVQGGSIGTPAGVTAAAVEAGIDPARLEAGLQDPQTKAALKTRTDEAIDRGIFGSPFMVVDGEAFWGVDRLDQLAWRLAGP